MLILAIILLGMLAGAAAQLIFRGGHKRPIDWTAAIVVGPDRIIRRRADLQPDRG